MKKIFFLLVMLALILSACDGVSLPDDSGTQPEVEGAIFDADYAKEVCDPRPVDSFDPITGEIECAHWDQDQVSEELSLMVEVPLKEPEQKVGKEIEEPVAESGCPPARDLGPWAPNNGLGEDFEVTCNETNCVGTHIQLWWPAGSGQEWGTQEISVFLPPGLSIEVQDGAGRGWEYALSCSLEEIESQVAADNIRRSDDTSYFGRVDIEDLINTGLVVVRFDRR